MATFIEIEVNDKKTLLNIGSIIKVREIEPRYYSGKKYITEIKYTEYTG